jgi:peptide/nickel transport system substrate-binding protein
VASLIDRESVATEVYKGLYTPLCSYVPDGMPGANTAVCDAYPLDVEAAAKYLSDAGLTTPVVLNLEYNPDHYGNASDQEYTLIKKQLEDSGLFTVNLQSAEWTTYSKERTADAYPVYQLGWFPDFPDADNYLTPFFGSDNNFVKNHFDTETVPSVTEVQEAIAAELTETDAAARKTKIEAVQTLLAEKYLPTIPLLQGQQWAVTRANVDGVKLGADENLAFGPLFKTES